MSELPLRQEDLARVEKRPSSLSDYLRIARFDHATKHVFILPGIVLAYALRQPEVGADTLLKIVLGLISAVCIASANYVINEWLDRTFDSYHPEKSSRPAVNVDLKAQYVYLWYGLLALVGLGVAALIGPTFFVTSVLFWISGITYNVRPFRTKDRAYVDVLSESLNNPLRLMLGWAMIDPSTLPPSSLMLAYWAGGAFLMAAKRLSEYREIAANGKLDMLHLYRRSFRFYTAETLTVSCFLYGVMSAFAAAVFLIKYRIEYVLAMPLLAGLFALYLALSMRAGSVAQKPEKLFRERRLIALSTLIAVLLIVLTFVEIPAMAQLSEPYLIPVAGTQ